MKPKGDLRKALAVIMERAKVHRDFANTEYERARWEEVLQIVNDALESPSMADIERHIDKCPKCGRLMVHYRLKGYRCAHCD